MSRDNFKDEFEKSKQKVEREQQATEELQEKTEQNTVSDHKVEEKQSAKDETNEIFPPRGASRRNRSQERKNREKLKQNNDIDATDTQKQDQAVKKEAVVLAGAKTAHDRKINHKADTNNNKQTTHHEQNKKKINNEPNNKKKVAAGAAIGAGVAGNKQTQANISDEHQKLKEEDRSNGNGLMKYLPIIAAILLLIPIIFLLSNYINNQGDNKNKTEEVVVDSQSTKEKSDKTTEKADKSDKAKDDNKTVDSSKDKAATTTEDSQSTDKTSDQSSNDEDNNVAGDDTNNATNSSANAAAQDNTQTNISNNTQATPNASQNTANNNAVGGGASHVVGAQENLYRIAIKYYGSGTPENVDKIRRANGITGNNLTQGQTLVIPK
ncbi:LysM peptidoglycan-binding domain-containing protein [Macrococcoides caseolyticum]|uniref:LysM peptidoglycan-binding domain-containing protein n=1 Tax=Macrococcoides caseolyticum TaxID=69966 RepID=UPI001F2916DE|nr:LysM peptidoglycan-binding domain-containing protein [Macrococcus caseolyticus]MCE4957084.1 LysM peptidoglycan-binding domain-containing protein [Macrococcus caseolyticus]